MRRHGWQLPLHPLQIVGISVYSLLVAAFYLFIWPFLGNKLAQNTLIAVFSFTACSVAILFIRCAGIDPSDRKRKKGSKGRKSRNLNYSVILRQILKRFSRRLERKVLNIFIRRNYKDSGNLGGQIDLLLPFPLIEKDDSVATHPMDDDISFCSICDSEVKLHSKHCKSCDRCVDGFDHHCRWLNNCVGRKNYTSFVLLMVLVLLMLLVEEGGAITVFVRCFADKNKVEDELRTNLKPSHIPRGVLAGITAFLFLLSGYALAALGQLFIFHVVLIRKGMRTYDYILAMRDQSDLSDSDLDSSEDDYDDVSIDFSDASDKPSLLSRFLCGCHISQAHKSKFDEKSTAFPYEEKSTVLVKPDFSIDPWNLIRMNREKAMAAAERARERMKIENYGPKPLPWETKKGPFVKMGPYLSPRRRFSGSPSPKQKESFRGSFDLRLSEVSKDLDSYISRQVVCSVLPSREEDSSS